MVELIAIISLTLTVFLLLADRYLSNEQHQKEKDKILDELSKAIKAVIAKNANEYVMTTSIDKVAPEEKTVAPPDIVPEESISDDEFFEAIQKGNKKK